MPEAWELKNKLNPNNAEDRNVIAKNGYSMLEEYLNVLNQGWIMRKSWGAIRNIPKQVIRI